MAVGRSMRRSMRRTSLDKGHRQPGITQQQQQNRDWNTSSRLPHPPCSVPEHQHSGPTGAWCPDRPRGCRWRPSCCGVEIPEKLNATRALVAGRNTKQGDCRCTTECAFKGGIKECCCCWCCNSSHGQWLRRPYPGLHPQTRQDAP